MNRLFLRLPLLLAPAARAMDYVKCEAINKAYGRHEYTRNQEIKRARSSAMDAAAGNADAYVEQRLKCAQSATTAEAAAQCWKDPNLDSAADSAAAAVRAAYKPRMDKVKADYQAAGCY